MNIHNLLRLNAKRGSFKAEANTIWLYDVIVSDDWTAEYIGGVSPMAFIETLRGLSGTVHLRINSPGGEVFAATAMAQAMREYPGEIISHVDGLAASAASVVAVAAPKVVMAPGSLMMIHRGWTFEGGNAKDFQKTVDLLNKVDGQIAQSYARKSGKAADGFLTMMDAETWFTPEEAKEAGIADDIAGDAPKAEASWDLTAYAAAPVATWVGALAITANDIEARNRRHAAAMLLKTA